MYRDILVPTHVDDAERPALSVAFSLGVKFGAELRLVQVETDAIVLAAGATGLAEAADLLEGERATRRRKLEALAAECRALGVPATTTILEGPAGPTLTEYAKKRGVDLIIMASHARGGLKRLSLGSVTDFVIRNTHIPVLVVKPNATFVTGAPGGNAAQILVPLDGSALAEEILPHVESLAASLSATVCLLQIVTPFDDVRREIMDPGLPWWETEIASGETYLSRVARYLTEKGLTVRPVVFKAETIASGIRQYAERECVDLIALATSGSGGIKRLLLGTVADEVARKAPVSVLVFHPGFVTSEIHDRITPRASIG
jgi:nucleotide-binding universal stress UspA family protein